VLTYEMLLGQSPFRGDDEDEIFDAILEDEPLYPITMPKDAVSILQKVCLVTVRPTNAERSVSFLPGILLGDWALGPMMHWKSSVIRSSRM